MSATYSSSYDGSGTGGSGYGPWASCAHGYGPPFPVKAAIVIGGLALFPPLGIAALAYFALRHKFGHGGWGPPPWAGRGGHCGGHWRRPDDDDDDHRRERADTPTGNSAFEARRREVLDKLEAERQKLRDEAQAFRDFAEKERKARDQAEFDRYTAEKDRPADEPKSNG